jgi:hypothetical protein
VQFCANPVARCESRSVRGSHSRARGAQVGWLFCNVVNVFDQGEFTGCSPQAVTFESSIAELAEWLRNSADEEDVLLVFVDDFTNNRFHLVREVFDRFNLSEQIFLPQEFFEFNNLTLPNSTVPEAFAVSVGRAGRRVVWDY